MPDPYVDRVNISTAAPLIKAELGLSNTGLGLVLLTALTKLCTEHGISLPYWLGFWPRAKLQRPSSHSPGKEGSSPKVLDTKKLLSVSHGLERTALKHLQFVAVSIPPDSSKRGWCLFSPRVTP